MARDTGILNSHMMQEIKDITLKIATNALGKMHMPLTKAEFIEAFIQPEHVQRLSEIHDLIGGQKAESTNVALFGDDGDKLIAQVRYMKQPDMLVPKYINTDFRYWTPAGKKVAEWAAERKRQGFLVADAIDAMEWMNDNAGSAMGFALMFPALVPIMSRGATDGSTPVGSGVDPAEHWIVRKGQQIANLKTLSKPMPVLPREVINRIRDASAFIMALMMTRDARLEFPADTCAMLVGVPADALSPASLGIYSRNHVILGDTFNVRSFI